MELVINILEEDFEIMKHNVAVNNPLCPISQEKMVAIIANGVPLPKGHGRLGDLDELLNCMEFEVTQGYSNEYGCLHLVKQAQTLIKAENES